jgi:hypothetical protein
MHIHAHIQLTRPTSPTKIKAGQVSPLLLEIIRAKDTSLMPKICITATGCMRGEKKSERKERKIRRESKEGSGKEKEPLANSPPPS